MGYFKFYYVLLDLKKIVIFVYFNVTIYIEFEFFNYLLVYLVNWIFSITFFNFLSKFAYFINIKFLFFSSTRFIVVGLQILNTKQH
jgi:hypothetical protein